MSSSVVACRTGVAVAAKRMLSSLKDQLNMMHLYLTSSGATGKLLTGCSTVPLLWWKQANQASILVMVCQRAATDTVGKVPLLGGRKIQLSCLVHVGQSTAAILVRCTFGMTRSLDLQSADRDSRCCVIMHIAAGVLSGGVRM